MRNVLKYYYNLSFDQIKEYDDYAILEFEDKIYIFKKYIQEEEETKYIGNLLFNNGIITHTIIINNQDSILTDYNSEKYILLQLKNFKEEIGENFFYVEVPKKETDIATLWSNKLDYYAHQLHELGLGKEFLINTFNYYMGLAENAIQIYNRASESTEEVHYAISHRRMTYPNYSINYLDPTNMLIDVRIRDVAEYIKVKFFSSGITVQETYDLLSKYNVNSKEINYLYARLFYPTYFFDIFENDIIKGIEEEDKIYVFLNKHEEYEKYLYDLYLYLRDYFSIYEVEWLKKEGVITQG